MREHTNPFSAILSEEPAKRLVAPGKPELLACLRFMAVMTGFLLGMLVWAAPEPVRELLPLSDDNQVMLWSMLLGCLMAALLMLGFLVQRVEIRGDVIRSKSIASLYRWRTWSAHEVVGISVRLPTEGMAVAMNVLLAPAPHRRWNVVTIGGFHGFSETKAIDNRFFIALAEAVTAANPAMRIKLPPNYSGALNWFREDD